jgi:hypothetical protein
MFPLLVSMLAVNNVTAQLSSSRQWVAIAYASLQYPGQANSSTWIASATIFIFTVNVFDASNSKVPLRTMPRKIQSHATPFELGVAITRLSTALLLPADGVLWLVAALPL